MKNEPAVVRGIIGTALALAVTLGFVSQTDSEAALSAVDAILAAVLVLIPIVQAVFTRAKVTPVETADANERLALFIGEPVPGDDLNEPLALDEDPAPQDV
jgi:hypothetical protein